MRELIGTVLMMLSSVSLDDAEFRNRCFCFSAIALPGVFAVQRQEVPFPGYGVGTETGQQFGEPAATVRQLAAIFDIAPLHFYAVEK